MISWENAPDWANWVAMDESLDWYWYENKPALDEWGCWEAPGRCKKIYFDDIDYDKSLEERP